MLSQNVAWWLASHFHVISLAFAVEKLPLPPNPNATRVVTISSFCYQDHGGIHFYTFVEKKKKKRKKKSEHSNTMLCWKMNFLQLSASG